MKASFESSGSLTERLGAGGARPAAPGRRPDDGTNIERVFGVMLQFRTPTVRRRNLMEVFRRIDWTDHQLTGAIGGLARKGWIRSAGHGRYEIICEQA